MPADYSEALVLVAGFADPLLGGVVATGYWDPESQSWLAARTADDCKKVSEAESEEVRSLMEEVRALRAENERLRSLLGLDRPDRGQAAQPWEPTLFVDSDDPGPPS